MSLDYTHERARDGLPPWVARHQRDMRAELRRAQRQGAPQQGSTAESESPQHMKERIASYVQSAHEPVWMGASRVPDSGILSMDVLRGFLNSDRYAHFRQGFINEMEEFDGTLKEYEPYTLFKGLLFMNFAGNMLQAAIDQSPEKSDVQDSDQNSPAFRKGDTIISPENTLSLYMQAFPEKEIIDDRMDILIGLDGISVPDGLVIRDGRIYCAIEMSTAKHDLWKKFKGFQVLRERYPSLFAKDAFLLVVTPKGERYKPNDNEKTLLDSGAVRTLQLPITHNEINELTSDALNDKRRGYPLGAWLEEFVDDSRRSQGRYAQRA